MCYRFQKIEKKERKKKEGSAGERRMAATGAEHASTVGWSNASPARRRHVSPVKLGQTANASRTGPVNLRLRRGWRACALRLAHSRARDLALPAHCRRMCARGPAVLAQLLSRCPIFVSVPVLILFLRE